MSLCVLVLIFLQGVGGQRLEVVGVELDSKQEETEENEERSDCS